VEGGYLAQGRREIDYGHWGSNPESFIWQLNSLPPRIPKDRVQGLGFVWRLTLDIQRDEPLVDQRGVGVEDSAAQQLPVVHGPGGEAQRVGQHRRVALLSYRYTYDVLS